MAKTATQVAEKYATRSAAASGDYVEGAKSTTRDQAAAAIAAAPIWKQAVDQAAASGSFAKGLQRAGKSKWLEGITSVGGNRYGEGVSKAAGDYASESAKFDTARNAANSLPRGIKGSPQNISRVTAVVNALVNAKKTK